MCPLPYDGSFVETFYKAWPIVRLRDLPVRLGGEFRRFDRPEFAGFDEPSYGRVATGFLVRPYGTGRRSLLCTETRTATTDPGLGPAVPPLVDGHRPVRRLHHAPWLTLTKQHAEQDPAAANRAAGQPTGHAGKDAGLAPLSDLP